MANLALTSAAPAAQLSRSTTAALLAYEADTPAIGRLALWELVPMIGDLLNGAALLLAHKNALDNPLDLELMAQAVAELVQRRFAGFKFAELSEAVRRGAAGEYKATPADVLYLSLPNVNNWLYAYQTSARHDAVKFVQASDAAAQLALPAPRRDLAAEVSGLLTLAMNGSLKPAAELDFANVLYDWLKNLGAFNGIFTAADYAEIKADATQELLDGGAPASGPDARAFRGFVAALLKDEWPAHHPLARNVNNAAKKHVLREWLLRHAAAETEPEALSQQLAKLDEQRRAAEQINQNRNSN